MYKFFYSVGNIVYCDVWYRDGRIERVFYRACRSSVDASDLADRCNDSEVLLCM